MNDIPPTYSAITATVSAFEIFDQTDNATREVIAQLLTLGNYKKNEQIISASSTSTDVYFILTGSARVSSVGSNGKEVHFEDLKPGTMFGELNALDPQERTSNCYCLEASTIARMSANNFQEIINNHPQIAQAVTQRLVRMVRRQMNRVFEFSTSNVRDRIRLELIRMANAQGAYTGSVEIRNAPTHSEIANRISTHREAVSRELKTLERAGHITWKPKRHVIHDIQMLAE